MLPKAPKALGEIWKAQSWSELDRDRRPKARRILVPNPNENLAILGGAVAEWSKALQLREKINRPPTWATLKELWQSLTVLQNWTEFQIIFTISAKKYLRGWIFLFLKAPWGSIIKTWSKIIFYLVGLDNSEPKSRSSSGPSLTLAQDWKPDEAVGLISKGSFELYFCHKLFFQSQSFVSKRDSKTESNSIVPVFFLFLKPGGGQTTEKSLERKISFN